MPAMVQYCWLCTNSPSQTASYQKKHMLGTLIGGNKSASETNTTCSFAKCGSTWDNGPLKHMEAKKRDQVGFADSMPAEWRNVPVSAQLVWWEAPVECVSITAEGVSISWQSKTCASVHKLIPRPAVACTRISLEVQIYTACLCKCFSDGGGWFG